VPAPTPAPSPPAAARAPQPLATLALHVNTSSARVWVDGQPAVLTGRDSRIDVSAGVPHELRLAAPGFGVVTRHVPAVGAGSTVVMDVSLSARPKALGRGKDATLDGELIPPQYGKHR
jgi:hypothetical protein